MENIDKNIQRSSFKKETKKDKNNIYSWYTIYRWEHAYDNL